MRHEAQTEPPKIRLLTPGILASVVAQTILPRSNNLLIEYTKRGPPWPNTHMVDAAVATPAGDAAHGASGANGDSTRGRPYYEKLRKDLRQTLERKRELDKTMVGLLACQHAYIAHGEDSS